MTDAALMRMVTVPTGKISNVADMIG